MYFSCSVDEKSSKFQISRTRGKVLCDIPKREDGTVGELVLQNPAPVPFHGLIAWDAKLHDIRYVPCKHSGNEWFLLWPYEDAYGPKRQRPQDLEVMLVPLRTR